MSPGSDWDLLLLHDGKGDLRGSPEPSPPCSGTCGCISAGACERSPSRRRRRGPTSAFRTALLDARHVAGDPSLWHRAERGLIEEQRTRGVEGYLQAKVDELRSRRERFGDTVFLLEPNPKQGQGDCATSRPRCWLAQVRFRARTLGALLEAALLPPPGTWPRRAAARDFLLRIRHAAHLATGRRRTGLTFELQASLAWRLRLRRGPRGRTGGALHAPRLRRRGHAAPGEATPSSPDRGGARPRRAPAPGPERRFGHFKTFHGRLTTENSVLFQEDSGGGGAGCSSSPPSTGLPLYSWARERVVEALPGVAESRGTPGGGGGAQGALHLTGGPGARCSDEMHALGVLGALVPEFGRITAHHQSDLYHVYTVDVHTLRALRRLYALRAGDLVDVEPALGRRMADLADPLPLYLGMLLHDAGKGMGGDHSGPRARADGWSLAAARSRRPGSARWRSSWSCTT